MNGVLTARRKLRLKKNSRFRFALAAEDPYCLVACVKHALGGTQVVH